MIKYYGDTTRWFIGRVVDIIDPLKLGRIKVRIYGIHTDNVIDISDDDLPWSQVVAPITEGGTNAFGNNLGLLPGAQVFGVFLDGTDSQMPLILGSMPKYEDESVDSISTNPLATGTQTKPYTPDSTIGEPDDPYAAVYPNNLVYETSAGHVKEYDNTTDAERIRELHKSGTFYQIGPDGDLVTHIVRDRYTVIASDDALHVKGNVNLIIDENCTTTIGGNWDVNVTGDITIDGRTINLNSGNPETDKAARTNDTVDTGDAGTGGHFDNNSAGTDIIETGSSTVFIGG
jgi:hypothetical protein